jgi:hypothetical protein
VNVALISSLDVRQFIGSILLNRLVSQPFSTYIYIAFSLQRQTSFKVHPIDIRLVLRPTYIRKNKNEDCSLHRPSIKEPYRTTLERPIRKRHTCKRHHGQANLRARIVRFHRRRDTQKPCLCRQGAALWQFHHARTHCDKPTLMFTIS